MCRKCKILYRLNRRRFHQILVAMRARLASMWNMHIPHEKLRRFFGWEILSFGCLSGVGMGLVTFHRFSDAIVLFSVACVVVGIQVLFRIFAIQDWWPWKVIAIALTFIGVSFCDSYLTRVAIEQEGEYYAALIEKLARVPSRLPAAKPSTNDTAANTSPPVTKKQPRPLIKQDAFSTLIPFITEESSGMLIRARIPLDSNDNDPLRLTYSEIASIGDILLMPEVDPQSGVVKAPTLTDVDMRNFLGRVLQYYTLLAIGKMQHTVTAMNYESGKGATTVTTSAVIVPDETEYPKNDLDKLLATAKVPIWPGGLWVWKWYPLKVPKGTTVSFSEASEGEKLFYSVCFVRVPDFRLDFKIEPAGRNQGQGAFPRYFVSLEQKGIKDAYAYVFVISLNFQWNGDHGDGEPYVEWAHGLFSGLRKKLVIPN